MKVKVAIIYKIFNNYRKPVFDLLSSKTDLIVLHSADNSGIKNETAAYSIKVPNFFYGKKNTQVWLFVEKYLWKLRPDVVIHEFNPSILSLHTSYLYCRLLRKKFIVWGHGYNKHSKFNINSFKIKFRFFYLRKADAVLLYSQADKVFFSEYLPVEKLFVAQNTLDTNLLKQYRSEFESKGKTRLKEVLNYKHTYNIIYIGRIIQGKRPDILTDLCSLLVNVYKLDIGFQIIGSGPFLNEVIAQAKEKNVQDRFFFHGEIHDDYISGKHLFASDIFVMPGYLGLSINHAMCFDCPVVSFKEGGKGPFHSPEVEYVIPHKTGYLADSWNLEDMANWINTYLTSGDMKKEMHKEIRKSVDTVFPIEKMVDGIYDAVTYTMK